MQMPKDSEYVDLAKKLLRMFQECIDLDEEKKKSGKFKH